MVRPHVGVESVGQLVDRSGERNQRLIVPPVNAGVVARVALQAVDVGA